MVMRELKTPCAACISSMPYWISRRAMQRGLGYLELARRPLEGTAIRNGDQAADMRAGDLDLERFDGLAVRERRADERIAQRGLDLGQQPPDARQQDCAQPGHIGSGPAPLQQADP